MKINLILILSIFFLGCNSNTQNKNDRARKLTGKQVVEQLEHLKFFDLTSKSEIPLEKNEVEKSYDKYDFFDGAIRGETLEYVDNRFVFIDCEELFESGGLINYLKIVKPIFEKLGLNLEYSNEKEKQTESYYKHTIQINGKEYIAFDGNFSDFDWDIAYVKFIEILNEELKLQKSDEKFYPISSENDGKMVLLSAKQFDFIKVNYPDDKQNPKSIEVWKKERELK